MTHPPIGIDLGTTFSALAVINSAGHPEIVPNAGGERLTASVVYFEASAMDKPVVGQNALAAAGGFPDRVVRSMKRHMGEPDWRFTVDSREYSAVDISSLILKKVIQDAAETLGSLEYAVITIPAYFGELRHQTTKQAAEQAGIKVLRLINEPTAAALAYARAGHTLGKVLIYDYGGGTFDVTLAEIRSETEVEVIASAGDPALGGDDLDKALMKHLDSIFAKEYSISLIESGAAAKHNLRTTAEQAKKNLSELNEVHGVQLSWNNNFLNVSVSREEFEALIESQISQTEMLVEIVLSEAGMKPEDVDHVLLVGGSTRIPAVKRMLKKKFAQEPRASINGDEVVALGASIQAAIIMQERDLYQTPSMKGFELQDVTNFSYGTTALDHQTHQPINSIIIPKNTPIPHERTESFYTTHQGQTEINCRVTQGEGTDPEFVEVMANQVLSLPPDRPPHCEVKVTFSYDASGIMAAKFLDVESGRQSDLDIRIEGSDDGSENGSDDSSGAADGPDLQDDDGIDDLLL